MTTYSGKVLSEDNIVEGDLIYFDEEQDVFRPIRDGAPVPTDTMTGHVLHVSRREGRAMFCPDLRCAFRPSPLQQAILDTLKDEDPMSIPTHQHNWFTAAGERRDTCRECGLPIHSFLDEITARLRENETFQQRLNALETRIIALEQKRVITLPDR